MTWILPTVTFTFVTGFLLGQWYADSQWAAWLKAKRS